MSTPNHLCLCRYLCRWMLPQYGKYAMLWHCQRCLESWLLNKVSDTHLIGNNVEACPWCHDVSMMSSWEELMYPRYHLTHLSRPVIPVQHSIGRRPKSPLKMVDGVAMDWGRDHHWNGEASASSLIEDQCPPRLPDHIGHPNKSPNWWTLTQLHRGRSLNTWL